MLRVITDFDGPIMDVSERYYQVYQVCLDKARHPGQAVRPLSKERFWHLKRLRVPEWEIGMVSGLEPDRAREFARFRRQIVHSAPFLHHDRPYASALRALERLQRSRVDIAIATMRRTSELAEALERCRLEGFFSADRRYCLANDAVKTTDIEDKTRLLAKALAELPPASTTWMVGDTEADVIAAKTHGIQVIGILSGIRDRSQLEAHEPETILPDLEAAADRILHLSLLPTGS